MLQMLIWVRMLTGGGAMGIWQDWLNARPYFRNTREAFEHLSALNLHIIPKRCWMSTPT